MIWFLLGFLLHGERDTIVEVTPLPLHGESLPEGIAQIETTGSMILIRDRAEPFVYEFHSNGDWIQTIGGKGGGPGELGYLGTSALALSDSNLWIFHGNRLSIFHGSHFQKGHNLGKPFVPAHWYSSNTLAGFQGGILVALPQSDQTMAGYLIQWPNSEPEWVKFTEWKPASILREKSLGSPVMWAYDGNRIYRLFLFQAKVDVFSKELKPIQSFPFSGPEIELCDRNLELFNPAKHKPPMPHFSDFQVYGPSLFMMCRNALYQVSKLTGEVEHITYFKNEEMKIMPITNDFLEKYVDPPGYSFMSFMKMGLNFPFFRILDNGTLILSSVSENFGHLLWQAPGFLPPLEHSVSTH